MDTHPSYSRGTGDEASTARTDFDPYAVTRPDPVLLRYYFFISLFATVAFPFVFIPLYFRYHTLRFHFDDEGISISWGILFRKEVNLTYRRIQDIHVTRNIIQRWLGLATVEVQTASGNASAEITIEGLLQADALRDFLYRKMRGAREDDEVAPASGQREHVGEALTLLREIHDELVALNQNLSLQTPVERHERES